LTKRHVIKGKKDWRRMAYSFLQKSIINFCTADLLMENILLSVCVFMFTLWVLSVVQLVKHNAVERLKIN